MKYGTFVPSGEVAFICSTTKRDESKRAGADFTGSTRPSEVFRWYRVVGVSIEVTER